jgi:predicted Zn-dependent protease
MAAQMKTIQTFLAEESRLVTLTMDAHDNSECTVLTRSGIQERHGNGRWSSEAIAMPSLAEAIKPFVANSQRRDRRSPTVYLGNEALREHEALFAGLHALRLPEWKAVFRQQETRRWIRNRLGREFSTRFLHYSLQVRVKTASGWLDVGEGAVEQPKFNSDGLCRRIDDMLTSRRERRRVRFDAPVPVILQAGEGAILFHEILGHSLEADHIYSHQSPLSLDDLGRQILDESVSVSLADARDPFFQFITCDDEGERPADPMLVQQGHIRQLIGDLQYSRMLGVVCSGHSRCEDYSKTPLPRMFALYIQPGTVNPDDIIAATPYGILAREFGDGRVAFAMNRFHFKIRDAYLVEKGRVTAPLGDVTVGGEILSALKQVSLVGNDFKYDRGISYCHKHGQIVPVRVGQPTVRIDGLSVSGDGHD